jgi:hypothetical protein
MTVPKATVHKNNRMIFRENKIGPSMKSLSVETVPEAKREEASSHQEFGACVLASNAGHHSASDFRRDNISH